MGRPTPYHRGFASHSRRGVALLLALAALVIVLSALGATLTTLMTASSPTGMTISWTIWRPVISWPEPGLPDTGKQRSRP